MSADALKLAREALFWLLRDSQHMTPENGDPDRWPVQRAREALAALDALPAQAEPAELGPLPEAPHKQGDIALYPPTMVRAYAASETARLRAELEALRKDAGRYRFLRDVSTATWRSFQEMWRMPRERCDAAIDAAMSAPPASES